MKDLLAVVDEINHTRQIVECAWMATQGLEREEAEPLAVVLDLASDRLADIAKAIAAIKIRDDRSEGRAQA